MAQSLSFPSRNRREPRANEGGLRGGAGWGDPIAEGAVHFLAKEGAKTQAGSEEGGAMRVGFAGGANGGDLSADTVPGVGSQLMPETTKRLLKALTKPDEIVLTGGGLGEVGILIQFMQRQVHGLSTPTLTVGVAPAIEHNGAQFHLKISGLVSRGQR